MLDDLQAGNEQLAEGWFQIMQVIRNIARKVIDFLAQIEDFQKKLWTKKKFIIETNWCMTLDLVPSSLYNEILISQVQLREWEDLLSVNCKPLNKKLDTDTITRFCQENPYLMVDTRHFGSEFKEQLLAGVRDLDSQCNGTLVHSENFQAMQLLAEIYSGKVNTIYLDPPFNTVEGSFLYKNNYQHSSWACMMYDRIKHAKRLLCDQGIIASAIDDFEQPLLASVFDAIFGVSGRLGTLAVQIKPSGRTNDNFLATSHEYVLFYGCDPEVTEINFLPIISEANRRVQRSR